MLAELLVPPGSPQEWAIWAFHHRDNHAAIRAAIQAKKLVNLPEYELDPIPQALDRWVDNNQRAHNDMNAALGKPGSDLGELKIDNPQVLGAWIYSHYQEHLTANQALGI